MDKSAKARQHGHAGRDRDAFRDPTPWMLQAWQYRRSLGKLQLQKPKPIVVRMSGRDIEIVVAGSLDDVDHGGSIVALTRSRVAPGPVDIGRAGDDWSVTDAEVWGDGWDRLVLRLA